MFDFQRFTTVLLDMDGVLYRGAAPLAGARELLRFCERHGIRYACVTNSTTLTPLRRAAKLHAIGLDIAPTHIITAAVATRRYLQNRMPAGTSIYLIGMDGLHDALFGDGYFVAEEQQPQVVVVGQDETLTYAKCRMACQAILDGAHFVAGNPDVTVPTDLGIAPETGALLAYLQAATEVAPVVIGKPLPTMFQMALNMLDSDPRHTLVIGDRLDTDVAGAQAAGLASALVLTGVTTLDTLERSAIQPDAVFSGLPELIAAWEAAYPIAVNKTRRRYL